MELQKIIKVTEKTSGRDKLCRLVQYGSKLVYWLLEQKGLSPGLIERLKNLESSISTARKCKQLFLLTSPFLPSLVVSPTYLSFTSSNFSSPSHNFLHFPSSPSPPIDFTLVHNFYVVFRLGTSLTQFKAALQTIHLNNPLLRFLITLTKINRGFYLLIDHLIWANRMNLVSIQNKYWSRFSNQFWLLAIFLSLVRDVYELLKALRVERERLRQYQNYQPVTSRAICSVMQNNAALCVDVVKNCGDFLIPLSRLDLIYVPGGVVGLVGVVSSLAGLVATYNEHLKLKFS